MPCTGNCRYYLIHISIISKLHLYNILHLILRSPSTTYTKTSNFSLSNFSQYVESKSRQTSFWRKKLKTRTINAQRIYRAKKVKNARQDVWQRICEWASSFETKLSGHLCTLCSIEIKIKQLGIFYSTVIKKALFVAE